MVRINNLNFSYKRRHKLFEGLNMTLPKGTITGLFGKNGEGKTTLLKLIAGSLLPDSGDVLVLDQDPSKRQYSIQQKVFMLPEIVQCPQVKVRYFLDVMSSFYPTYEKDIEQECMKVFDLDGNMMLGKISQGQQKKVVITLAIASRAPLLLMDEPTNSLDIPSKAAFRQLMVKYLSEEQTVIISTHQVRDLESLIDWVVFLDNNKIVCNEAVYELSKRFVFDKVSSRDEKPLYKEITPIGEVGVFLRNEDADFGYDYFSLELFFNGVVNNYDEINKYLNL